MSLSRELAHELRPVNAAAAESVLPAWAKIIPIAFYVGMVFFVGTWAFNNFQINIHEAQTQELSAAVADAQEMIFRDKNTINQLTKLHNATVRVARWVDYTLMTQPILMGVFSPLDEQTQVTRLHITRGKSPTPEYTMGFIFRCDQARADSVVSAVYKALEENSWIATSNSQNYQEGSTDLQAFLTPISSVNFSSQSLALLQDAAEFNPEPSGVAQ